MAISRSKKDAIVDAQIDSKAVETKSSPEEIKKQEKKPGFLASTIAELKKVEWPSRQYTVRWATVIIIFTAGISLFLGAVDGVFTSGLKFVDCTTEISQSDDETSDLLQGCSQDLLNDLTFRDN